MRLTRISPFLALALTAAGMTADAATLTLSSPQPVTTGTSIDIDLSIAFSAAESLFAYQVTLFYPLFLQATSITETGYFGGNSIGVSSVIDNGTGTLSVFSSLSGSDILASGDTLFRITFDTLAAGSGLVDFDPSGLILFDGNFVDLSVSALNPGSVAVNAPADVPEVSTTWTVSAGLAAMLLTRLRRHFLFEPAARE